MIRRLRRRFAPDGLLHYGQGKWYPGEPLPRWTFGLYWRRDGRPVWQNPDLIAAEDDEAACTVEDAETLIGGVAASLGIDAAAVQPAFEDPWHFIGRERELPENLDPFDSRLDDPLERARLARVFDHGLGKPTGFALPVQRWQAKGGRGWSSEPWTTRAGRLLLNPGDSPVGHRLPLTSLHYIEPTGDYPYIIPTDPFAPREDLPGPESP